MSNKANVLHLSYITSCLIFTCKVATNHKLKVHKSLAIKASFFH